MRLSGANRPRFRGRIAPRSRREPPFFRVSERPGARARARPGHGPVTADLRPGYGTVTFVIVMSTLSLPDCRSAGPAGKATAKTELVHP